MLFKYTYNILLKKLFNFLKEKKLQIIIKIINDIINLNDIIFILFVFRIFLRIL